MNAACRALSASSILPCLTATHLNRSPLSWCLGVWARHLDHLGALALTHESCKLRCCAPLLCVPRFTTGDAEKYHVQVDISPISRRHSANYQPPSSPALCTGGVFAFPIYAEDRGEQASNALAKKKIAVGSSSEQNNFQSAYQPPTCVVPSILTSFASPFSSGRSTTAGVR